VCPIRYLRGPGHLATGVPREVGQQARERRERVRVRLATRGDVISLQAALLYVRR
jgi:hypothetical protein